MRRLSLNAGWSMIEVRTKDVLFSVIAVPAAVTVLYFHLWRNDAAAEVSAMRREISSLVSEEDFESEMSAARRRAADAEKELAAEKNVPVPAVEVKAGSSESEAERCRALAGVFRSAGLAIVRCDVTAADAVSGEVLRSTGTRPSPAGRLWVLEGSYPSLLSALGAMAEKKLAVIPVSVSFTPPSRISMNVSL